MIYSFGADNNNGQPLGTNSFRSDIEQNEPLLQLQNSESADIATADRLAREVLNISGANVKIYIRTENGDYDSVWDEDADPTYYPAKNIRAYFKPQPMEVELKRWGIDAPNKTEIVMSASDLKQSFGNRMLRSGDVVELPYNNPANFGVAGALNPKFYRITNATPSGNYRYQWIYYTCSVETLPADTTVRVINDMPDEASYEEYDREGL